MEKVKKLPKIVKKIKEHTPIPKGERSISFSQIQTYYDCPHKWELKYKKGFYEDKPSIHLTFGTSIHETLQHYLTIMYEESGTEADKFDIEDFFQKKLSGNYKKDYDKTKVHFSSPEEMHEFYYDGIEIINFLKKNRGKYFTKREWYLVGCEMPLMTVPNEKYPNITFKGFIDLVLYHEPTDSFTIIDIKTTGFGWSEKEKKDELKQAQLLFYKEFFSKQYEVPIDKISVHFLLLKRKLWENSQYPVKRILEHSPSQGSWKVKQSMKIMDKFLTECFNDDGSYQEKQHVKIPGKKCDWCPFSNQKELCDKKEGF